jgi:hypothetical protein
MRQIPGCKKEQLRPSKKPSRSVSAWFIWAREPTLVVWAPSLRLAYYYTSSYTLLLHVFSRYH